MDKDANSSKEPKLPWWADWIRRAILQHIDTDIKLIKQTYQYQAKDIEKLSKNIEALAHNIESLAKEHQALAKEHSELKGKYQNAHILMYQQFTNDILSGKIQIYPELLRKLKEEKPELFKSPEDNLLPDKTKNKNKK